MKREQPAEFVVFHDSGAVCRLYEGTKTRQEPNARAIAALPDLLAALDGLLDFAHMYGPSSRASREDWSGFLDDARAALLKAGATE